MRCPSCKGDLITKDSRPSPLNTIRRVKECRECKNKIVTYEYIGLYPLESSENRSPKVREQLKQFSKSFMS